MLRTSPIFLIFLLCFSHHVTCNKVDDFITWYLSVLSGNTASCSEYFQYSRIDDFINAKLTLPYMEIGDTVKLTFYQDIFQEYSHSRGILSLDGSSQEVLNRLRRNQPISYRVDFPIRHDVPELSKIFVNDGEICETRFNKSSDEIMILEHTLDIVNKSLPVFTFNIHIPHFAESPTCGVVETEIANRGDTPLAYGAKTISPGEYPWLTAIYRKHLTGLSFVCGGSLVTSKIILSAAHCIKDLRLTAEKIIAMLGRYNLIDFMEDGYTIREIEAVILHPDYQPGLGFSDADLAVLQMKEHVSFTKYIKPICLWAEPADESRIVNQTGVVVGWGSDENGNSISVAPKKVNVQIVSRLQCLISSVAFNAFTSSRTLCAGNRDTSGPCKGDSGGGLMLNRNGFWMLRGIISLALTVGQRCDLQEYAVYCDIAKHMSWLQNYTKQQDPPVTGSLEDICGRPGTESRIEHPWLAAIYRKLPTGEAFYCTGSIISSRSVLVPADSLTLLTMKKLEQILTDFLRVYLGRYDLNNINENGVISREVATLIFHPEFKPSNRKIHDDNIALLQMKDPVSFTQYVKPICLWTQPMDQSEIVGQSATVATWEGFKVRREISTVPTSTQVNISSLEECQMLDYNVSTSSRMLCISGLVNNYEGILMLKRNGRWLIRGVSSWRYFDGPEKMDFGLYADIAQYMLWIQNNILS